MYLVFDTETTGLGKDARMTQLAFVVLDENYDIVKHYSSLVQPDGWEVPNTKFFIDNGMSTERCAEYGDNIYHVLEAFEAGISCSKIVIAHNMKFDARIIENEYASDTYGVCSGSFLALDQYCTMEQSKKVLESSKHVSLVNAHLEIVGYDFEGNHDAMADVLATARLFEQLHKSGEFRITI